MVEMRLPDIGDFAEVRVIEVHVGPGDQVAVDDPVLTLESDKATMDVPAPVAGTVTELRVGVGDDVSQGDVILSLEPLGDAPSSPGTPAMQHVTQQASPTTGEPAGYGSPSGAYEQIETGGTTSAGVSADAQRGEGDVHAEVLVLGAGPGGYTAAFRAADLGKNVVLVDDGETLGGVCLNVGCIPSKALLHAAKVVSETAEMAEHGVSFGPPRIDLDALRSWKDGVVSRLTGGLAGLARQRKVTTVRASGRFVGPNALEARAEDGRTTLITFDSAIVAAGSAPVELPFIPHDDPRVIDSTGALALRDVPGRLLVIGGGIIGLEMATVYSALGSRITVVELMDQLIPGADKDLVAPLTKRVRAQYEAVHLKAKVIAVEPTPEGLRVRFEGHGVPESDVFDRVLVAVGRRPNGRLVGAEQAGVTVDDRGFIPVDKQMRTNVAHIFAIGDVVGQPMLAHKATHEAKVAAEAATGRTSFFDARVIPSVAYTDPEVAWVGVTELEAKAAGISYGKGVFPWAASGRSLSLGRDEGMTKLLFEEATDRIIGCGIVGPSAGELIAEAAVAIEMGADAADLAMTIHPHPTLSETAGMAAEAFEGTITDLYVPKKK